MQFEQHKYTLTVTTAQNNGVEYVPTPYTTTEELFEVLSINNSEENITFFPETNEVCFEQASQFLDSLRLSHTKRSQDSVSTQEEHVPLSQNHNQPQIPQQRPTPNIYVRDGKTFVLTDWETEPTTTRVQQGQWSGSLSKATRSFVFEGMKKKSTQKPALRKVKKAGRKGKGKARRQSKELPKIGEICIGAIDFKYTFKNHKKAKTSLTRRQRKNKNKLATKVRTYIQQELIYYELEKLNIPVQYIEKNAQIRHKVRRISLDERIRKVIASQPVAESVKETMTEIMDMVKPFIATWFAGKNKDYTLLVLSLTSSLASLASALYSDQKFVTYTSTFAAITSFITTLISAFSLYTDKQIDNKITEVLTDEIMKHIENKDEGENMTFKDFDSFSFDSSEISSIPSYNTLEDFTNRSLPERKKKRMIPIDMTPRPSSCPLDDFSITSEEELPEITEEQPEEITEQYCEEEDFVTKEVPLDTTKIISVEEGSPVQDILNGERPMTNKELDREWRIMENAMDTYTDDHHEYDIQVIETRVKAFQLKQNYDKILRYYRKHPTHFDYDMTTFHLDFKDIPLLVSFFTQLSIDIEFERNPEKFRQEVEKDRLATIEEIEDAGTEAHSMPTTIVTIFTMIFGVIMVSFGLHTAAGSMIDKIPTSFNFVTALLSKGESSYNTLATYIGSLLGEESPELLRKNDIMKQIVELEEYTAKPMEILADEPTFVLKFNKLIDLGNERLKLLDNKDSLTIVFGRTLEKAKARYYKLRSELRSMNNRPVPHVNLFLGDRGIGKTFAAIELSNRLATKHFNYQSVYTVDATESYWPVYFGQAVMQVQEFGNSIDLKQDLIAKNFNKLVSNLSCNIQGAYDKEMFANFKVMNMDTNTEINQIKAAIPMTAAGTQGFIDRLTVWRAVWLLDKENLELKRNERGFKKDFSHIGFYLEEYDSRLQDFVNKNDKLYTLSDIEKYTMQQVEVNERNFYPMKQEAKRRLIELDRIYQAENKTESAKYHTVFNFHGPSGSGKTTTVNKIVEDFKNEYNNMRVVWVKKTTDLDIKQYNEPHVVIIDDILLATNNRYETEEKLMRYYNDVLPNGCLIIYISNDIPQTAGYTLSVSTTDCLPVTLPAIDRIPVYEPIFFVEGLHRRFGYSGRFLNSTQKKPSLEDTAIKPSYNKKWLYTSKDFYFVNNDTSYLVENGQFKNTNTGAYPSRTALQELMFNRWLENTQEDYDIKINKINYRPSSEGVSILIRVPNIAELKRILSSKIAMLTEFAKKSKNFYISPAILLRFSAVPVDNFVYRGSIEDHNDVISVAEHFGRIMVNYHIEGSVYVEVTDTATARFEKNDVKLYINSLDECEHGEFSFILPEQINDNTKIIIMKGNEEYHQARAVDIYNSLFANVLTPSKINKIPVEPRKIYHNLNTKETFQAYIVKKYQAELEAQKSNESDSWFKNGTTMLLQFGLGIGVLFLFYKAITGVFGLFTSERVDREVIIHYHTCELMNVPVPQVIKEKYESYTPEQLNEFADDIIKLQRKKRIFDPDKYDGPENNNSAINKFKHGDAGKRWKELADYKFDDDDALDALWLANTKYKHLNIPTTTQTVKNPTFNKNDSDNLTQMYQVHATNLIKVRSENGTCFGLGIKDRLFVIPRHLSTTVVEIFDDRAADKKFYGKVVKVVPDADLCIVQAPADFPLFKDITKSLLSYNDEIPFDTRATLVRREEDRVYYMPGEVFFYRREPVKIKIGHMENVGRLIATSYEHEESSPTSAGDCGQPYYLRPHNGLPVLAGIHIAASKQHKTTFASALYKEDFQNIEYIAPQKVEEKLALLEDDSSKCSVCKHTGSFNLDKTSCVNNIHVTTTTTDDVGTRVAMIGHGQIYDQAKLFSDPKNVLEVLKKFKLEPTTTKFVKMRIKTGKCQHVRFEQTVDLNTRFFNKVKDIQELTNVLKDERALVYMSIHPEHITFYSNYTTKKFSTLILKNGTTTQCLYDQVMDFREKANENMAVVKPNIPFTQKGLKVFGTLNFSPFKEPSNTFKPTPFADIAEKYFECERFPVLRISQCSEEQLNSLSKDTDGNPSQLAHQALMLDEELPHGDAKLMEYIKEQMTDYYYVEYPDAFSMLTEDQVLNGVTLINSSPLHPYQGLVSPMDPHTSAGPIAKILHHRTLKTDYFERDDKDLLTWKMDGPALEMREFWTTCLERAKAGARSPVGYMTCTKVELLKKAKIHTPRSFEASDLVLYMLEKTFCGKFIARSTSKKTGTTCMVGFNSAVDFYHIYNKAKDYKYFFAVDINRHDKRVPYEISHCMTAARIKAHRKRCELCDKYGNCDWARGYTAVSQMMYNSERIIGNSLVRCKRGMPSGTNATANDNSELVFIQLLYAWIKLTGQDLGSMLDNCFIITYGDDQLVCMKEGFQDKFNLINIAKILGKDFGIIVDSDRKDGKPTPYTESIFDHTFCSRHFYKLENDVVVGALKKMSITSSLFWVKEKCDEPEYYNEMLKSFLLEAGRWGREYYLRAKDCVLDILASRCGKYLDRNMIMTYEYVLSLYVYMLHSLPAKVIVKTINSKDIELQIYKMFNYRMKMNNLAQTHKIVISTQTFDFGVEGMWELTTRVQFKHRDGWTPVALFWQVAYTKVMCKEQTAHNIVAMYELIADENISYEEAVGLLVLDKINPERTFSLATLQAMHDITTEMIPTPSRMGGARQMTSGNGLATNTGRPTEQVVDEPQSMLVAAAGKVDDANNSTAVVSGNVQTMTSLPTSFNYDVFDQFFKASYEYGVYTINKSKSRGALITKISSNGLADSIPGLSDMLAAHTYSTGHFNVKVSSKSPQGTLGAVMVAIVPAGFTPDDKNPIQDLKQFGCWEIINLDGMATRIFKMDNVYNQGFARAQNNLAQISSQTNLFIYLETPIQTTFAVSEDTTGIQLVVDIQLSEDFAFSAPRTTLANMLAKPTDTQIKPIRPEFEGRSERMEFQQPLSLTIGGNVYAPCQFTQQDGAQVPFPKVMFNYGVDMASGFYYSLYIQGGTQNSAFVTYSFLVYGDTLDTSFKPAYTTDDEPGTKDLDNYTIRKIFMNMFRQKYDIIYLGERRSKPLGYINSEFQFVKKIDDYPFKHVSFGTEINWQIYHISSANSTSIIWFPIFDYASELDSLTIQNNTIEIKLKGVLAPTFVSYQHYVGRPFAPEVDLGTEQFFRIPINSDAYTCFGTLKPPVYGVEETQTTTQFFPFYSKNTLKQRYNAFGLQPINVFTTSEVAGRNILTSVEHNKLAALLQQTMKRNGWESIAVDIYSNEVFICQVGYTTQLGMQINSSIPYLRYGPLTEIELRNFTRTDQLQLVDTTPFSTYYVSARKPLRPTPDFSTYMDIDTEASLAVSGILGGVSGIASGISGYYDRKNEKELREEEMANNLKIAEDKYKNDLGLMDKQGQNQLALAAEQGNQTRQNQDNQLKNKGINLVASMSGNPNYTKEDDALTPAFKGYLNSREQNEKEKADELKNHFVRTGHTLENAISNNEIREKSGDVMDHTPLTPTKTPAANFVAKKNQILGAYNVAKRAVRNVAGIN